MAAIAVTVLAGCRWWIPDRALLRVGTILAAVGLTFSLNQTILIATNIAQLSDDGAPSSHARTGMGLTATLIGLGLATLFGVLARPATAKAEQPAPARSHRPVEIPRGRSVPSSSSPALDSALAAVQPHE
jgi:hypothetical protein